MEYKSTDELNHEIESATDFVDYITNNKENLITTSLSAHLNMLLSQKGLKVVDVIRGSLLGRAYVYQIFSEDKNPSRDKMIALAFGLHLSGEETQKMLKLSGNRELYARDERDALILFAIHRKKNIMETNELLIDHGFNVLDTTKE
ncbi:MAG: XRE family transcriptional regulator [Lachnospiraceae bacterium]|nr:XRE family transcriptional regulator [Lachnospiraceae bacterium]